MRTFFTVNSSREQNEIALNKIENKKQLTLFACDIACSVLHVWLNQFPDDVTIPNFLQIIEDFIFGLTDLNQLVNYRSKAESTYYNTYYTSYVASRTVYYASSAAYVASRAVCDADVIDAASNAVSHAANASNNNPNHWNFTYNLYRQTFKPNHIIIPKLPIFLELAQEIKSTRNFELYNVLTDAIMDYSNIKINTNCLGLSNWLLFHLLIK